MVQEIANIEIKAGLEQEFESGVAAALPTFEKAKGFVSLKLRRNIERPELYHLCIEWETLENHTVDFRESEGFQIWRGFVSPCFAQAPEVSHNKQVPLRPTC